MDDDRGELLERQQEDWLDSTVGRLNRLGVPETAIRLIPPLAVLFGLGALPAAGVAVTTVLAAGAVAALKQRSFSQAVLEEIHAAVGDVEERLGAHESGVEVLGAELDALDEKVEETRREAREMGGRLSAAQVEELGQLFEQYMASLDEDWLEHLRRVARGVVRGDSPAFTRRVIITNLRGLGPEHVEALRELVDRAGQGEGYGRIDNLPDRRLDLVVPALAGAGFLDNVTVRMDGLLTLRVTPLGRVALRLLDSEV